MIISLPVHTAVWDSRGDGAFVVVVTTQVSVLGSYIPPVLKSPLAKSNPPHTTILLPVHTAVWYARPLGTFVVLVVWGGLDFASGDFNTSGIYDPNTDT